MKIRADLAGPPLKLGERLCYVRGDGVGVCVTTMEMENRTQFGYQYPGRV